MIVIGILNAQLDLACSGVTILGSSPDRDCAFWTVA